MLTPTQTKILAAIEAGHTTTRTIARATGMASNSNVMRQLTALAVGGHIVLEPGAHGLVISTGREYAAGWDLACRAAGNPNA